MAKQAYREEDKALFTSPETIKACLAAFLLPGMGHFLLGRKKKGLILGAVLLLTLILGMLQGGDFFPRTGEGTLRSIGWFLQTGMGLPGLVAHSLIERGSPLNPTYDFGTAYLLIAGMLNWLCVVDTFDIAVGRK
ncbi:MAG: hypothetical protein H6510_11055 [Acidobacteria bacterium]|nr:hypothetical protein [Acidobacteriota bacterium]MCB9398344.1 hypothetical protein [Acidobacteriota bacterium]